MTVGCGRSPTKVLNGQSIDRSFGPGPFLRNFGSFNEKLFSKQVKKHKKFQKIINKRITYHFNSKKNSMFDHMENQF